MLPVRWRFRHSRARLELPPAPDDALPRATLWQLVIWLQDLGERALDHLWDELVRIGPQVASIFGGVFLLGLLLQYCG